jgi:hypothetical protein
LGKTSTFKAKMLVMNDKGSWIMSVGILIVAVEAGTYENDGDEREDKNNLVYLSAI